MTTLAEEISVIQKKNTVSFDILLCKIDIVVSKKFDTALYQVYFRIRKIKDGNNTWTFTSHFTNENCELISVKNNKDGNLRTEEVIRDDSKLCHNVFLGDLDINQEIEFTVNYKEKLISTKLSKYDVLFDRYFISFIKVFPNYCKLLKIKVYFENPRSRVIASYPDESNKESKIEFEKRDISPYEHSTISLIAFTGLLVNKNAIIIEKLLWSVISGIIGIVLGMLIKIFGNGN